MRIHAMLIVVLLASPAFAEVKTKTVEYEYDGQTLKGFMAWDDSVTGKRPGVLIVHEWWGLDDDARKRARMLAELGYVAFACDMYGDGKTVDHPMEAGAMASKVRSNVETWRGRAMAGLKVLQDHEMVDSSRMAAIGYCFGGSTALQLALAGTDLKAVVSFHGALPEKPDASKVKSTVLICHGGADNFIPEANAASLREAFEKANVDYTFVYHGGARHSFTVKGADEHGIDGLKYDEDADRRSWSMMRMFFQDAFDK